MMHTPKGIRRIRRAGAAFTKTISIAVILSGPLAPATARGKQVSARPFENALRRAIAVEGEVRDRFSLAERMEHYRVPGVSVAVIEGCRIVDARGFGSSPGGPPIDPRTLFQAGSISKTVTAIAALKLVDQKQLTLDGNVQPLLTSWALPRSPQLDDTPVSLRMLLGHTAGIKEIGGLGYSRGTPIPTLRQILDGAAPANTPPVRIERTPATGWEYSSGGYYVVQALMTDVTGEPFSRLADRLVLAPAGMARSTFAQPLDRRKAGLAANSVGPDGFRLEGGWLVNPELAAGGLWSTPSDLARLSIALARSVRGEKEGILGPDAVREMMKRGLGNWGLGVELGRADGPRRFGHTGHNTGYVSEFVMYPDTCQGAVVMTNADQGGWLVTEVLAAIGEAYGWPGRRPRPVQAAIPLTDAIAGRFVGTYQLRDFPSERFTISRKPVGSLYWARVGYVGRDLLPESGTRLFSPDSRMALEVPEGSGANSTMIELSFGGGKNIALRLR